MLDQLRSNHREIARLKFEKFTPAEIAQQTGMALATVRGILADPLCKAHIDKLQDEADTQVVDVRKRLAEMSIKATDVLDQVLDSLEEKNKLAAAKDVLDRAGYTPRFKHEHIHAHLSREDIESLKARARPRDITPSDGSAGAAQDA